MSRPDEDPVRAFIGIELTDEVRAALDDRVHRLRRCPVRVSWTPPERMHLTLVFLGEIAQRRVQRATDILEKACGETDAFAFGVRGLGTFGSARRPSVIWAGIPEPLKRHFGP